MWGIRPGYPPQKVLDARGCWVYAWEMPRSRVQFTRVRFGGGEITMNWKNFEEVIPIQFLAKPSAGIA
jgi:hypothetical protein